MWKYHMTGSSNIDCILLCTANICIIGALVTMVFDAICKAADCFEYVAVCGDITLIFIVAAFFLYMLSIVFLDL